jgi:hypothetical protein
LICHIRASPAQRIPEDRSGAAGSWLAGAIYGCYAPAFATGLAFNIANFAIIAGLVVLRRGTLAHPATARSRSSSNVP